MSSEIVTGLFTAIGAVIGASVTLAANIISSRTQRRIASNAQSERATDSRRLIYTSFLTSVDSVRDRCRDLAVTLGNNRPIDLCDQAQRAHKLEWEDFIHKYPPVQIAGPDDVATCATDVIRTLSKLSDVCDHWYDSYAKGNTSDQWSEFEDAIADLKPVRKTFVEAARRASWPRP